MSARVVTLFAGQGAQFVGMGHDLYGAHAEVRAMFDRADDVLGFSLTRTMFEGPIEELTRTSRCQPALYVHGLAGLKLLKKSVPGLEIVAAAGLSLGELAAHAAVGTFDFETGLNLVYKRGAFMEEDTTAISGTMAAMVGGREEDVRALAVEVGVDVANLNAPGQTVLSGTRDGIARAIAGAKSHGIKIAKELAVAGAYHSRLMHSAQDKLAVELANTEMSPPSAPVICNVEARPVTTVKDVKATLEAQVTGSVRWAESMRWLLDEGHLLFVELGPGSVLTGLMKRIDRSARVISVSDCKSLDEAVDELRGP